MQIKRKTIHIINGLHSLKLTWGDNMKSRIFIFICILSTVLFVGFINEEKTVSVISQSNYEKAEERAKELIKKLYKNGVPLKEDEGDGTTYVKRYYCSNVCIDILSDGNLRYLTDVNDADGEDKFLTWLNGNTGAEIISQTEVYGFIFRRVKSGIINCDICIEKDGGRVVAARIIFNS